MSELKIILSISIIAVHVYDSFFALIYLSAKNITLPFETNFCSKRLIIFPHEFQFLCCCGII
jgi:hypothetical protein